MNSSSETPKKAPTKSAVHPRWPKWVRWTLLAVIIVLIGAGGFAFIKARQTKAAQSTQSTLQTATVRQGDLTLQASGTGYLVAASESTVSFDIGGKLTNLYVNLGDKVETGQLLAQLDDSSEQTALENAKHALLELTSAEAIATARLNVVTAEKTLQTAQITLNSLKNWQNNPLIENAYASYVLAKGRLDQAQTAYDSLNVGDYINNPQEAQAYQSVYAALTAFQTAQYYWSAYSQKPTQRSLEEADANVALAQARLIDVQNYLTALTGGDVPADATGTALEQLRQAKLAVQTARDNLDATKLYAPISGTVMTLNAKVGQEVSGTIMTIDDLGQATIQFYMDSSDWSNVKVDYEVSVTFDALSGQTFTGKVTEVMPGLISVQGSSMVEGMAQLEKSVDEIGLPVGVEASIDVISGQAKNAILIPVEALHEVSAGQYTVFVMVNGKPTLHSVEVGLQDETFAEIKSGLKAGEVVTTGIVETKK